MKIDITPDELHRAAANPQLSVIHAIDEALDRGDCVLNIKEDCDHPDLNVVIKSGCLSDQIINLKWILNAMESIQEKREKSEEGI